MESWRRKLASLDEADRLYAVEDIQCDNEAELAKILTERLIVEDSQPVRATIAFRLKTMVCQDVFPSLFELFKSPDAYLRNAAVGIFSGGNDKASEFLGKHMDDVDREVRKLILDALFGIGTDQATALIRKAISDRAINVQVAAVEYVGQLGDKKAADDLVRIIRDQSEPMLLLCALEALIHIEDREAAGRALDVLAPGGVLDGLGPYMLPQAFELLGLSGRGHELVQVLDALPEGDFFADSMLCAITHYHQGGATTEDCTKRLLGILMKLINQTGLRSDLKYLAARLMAGIGPGLLPPQTLFELGGTLLSDENTAPAGLEVIAASGYEKAREKMEHLRAETDDPVLREICEELLAEIPLT